MDAPEPPRREWVRFAAMGLELAVTVLAGTLAGLWADRRWGFAPWGVLGGSLLGTGAGLYRFLRAAAGSDGDERRPRP